MWSVSTTANAEETQIGKGRGPMPFMPGFDERWEDAADYIIGISRDLWEERAFDPMKSHLDRDMVLRSPGAVLRGSRAAMQAAASTLAAFPDAVFLTEDVQTASTGQDSFYAAQRQLARATHQGPGLYGSPTDKPVRYRVLADYWCHGNAVQDEWLVEDRGAIVRQLGHDIADWTRAAIRQAGGAEAFPQPPRPETIPSGLYKGRGNDDPWGSELAETLAALAAGDGSAVRRQYDPAAELFYPGAEAGQGIADASRFWMALSAAFPGARFQVDHAIGVLEPLLPPRASVRWSLTGKHGGWGRFGRPSGADVFVMGMTQVEFGPRGLRREWTLLDDTAVWTQILLATGDL